MMKTTKTSYKFYKVKKTYEKKTTSKNLIKKKIICIFKHNVVWYFPSNKTNIDNIT